MNELISNQPHRMAIRRHLLVASSSVVLAVYMASLNPANAEDADRPTVWIDLGGQMELLQGTTSPFSAPFMTATPDPGSYNKDIFSENQRAPHHAFGLEGKITFQPENSDWIYSAGIRYGRAHANRHKHQQGVHPTGIEYKYNPTFHTTPYPINAAALADVRMLDEESHTVLDFTAGKDVGLGMLGRGGESIISAGVRFAQFSNQSSVDISARPHIASAHRPHAVGFSPPFASFYQYFLTGETARSFHGVGPSLSWNASAALIGDAERGELSFDWGINGAVLFGRQKARVSHTTQAYHLTQSFCKRYRANGACAAYGSGYPQVYSTANSAERSHSVVVPNFGGFAGLSVRYRGAKVSLGYRADFFFGAVDAGIDARHTENLGFQGPYATVSIGLGG